MRALLITALIFLADGLLASGCGSPTFPNEYTLSSLRLVALIADKPEVSPGDTVTITPILSDINGGGRALVYSLSACVDPGFSYGQDQTCDGVPSQQIIAAAGTAVAPLSGSNYTSVGGYASPEYTGAAASFAVTIPAATKVFQVPKQTLSQELSPYLQYNGVSYLLDYHLSSADGLASIHAVDRILVSTRTPKNNNPPLTAFTNPDGSTLTALPTSEEELSPVFGPGSVEQYQVEQSDGSFVTIGESLDVSWYSTDGNFALNNSQGSLSNTYWPPSPPPTAHKTVLMGVVHDGRGGVGALRLEF